MGFDGLPIYIVKHLQTIAKKEGFVDGYDVKHAAGSNVGDGFASTLLSVKLVGNRKKEPHSDPEPDELALMCKLQPSNAARNENFNLETLFKREVYMFAELLPALVVFQKSHQVPLDVAFTSFPKCYAAFHEDGSNESVIILEDVRPAGFEMWKKSVPTDYHSCRLVMEQIGRLHGLSFTLRDQQPDLFREFQELPNHYLNLVTSPGFASIINTSIENAMTIMDSSEDVDFLEHLSKNSNEIFTNGMDKELLGKYGVISHGDCWINNIMFSMDKVSIV